ncbi:type II toxin-antitoxin system prevent-host-death family antitoxin [Streptomyces sp. NPDC059743]|uniref:type II toxin-antitoxin system prevent-host-death family antitoxin n=1 Tax=Streptomyces sp. NPDC059743 TaxID=3346928 RepID=UPI003669A85A
MSRDDMNIDRISITQARCNLGPLVRWVVSRRVRVTIASRCGAVAVLVSAAELATLDTERGRPCAEPALAPSDDAPVFDAWPVQPVQSNGAR